VREYVFKILIDEQLSGEGYGQGNSAMEAFENGVEMGSVIIPPGFDVEVLALSDTGLGIRFQAMRQ